ncbi:hypothetical protein HMPREF9967_0893 [Streptococcus infantis SK1076]|uniref:Uncharacterized protein n=1 Tax=Streptococcus infantis SK1076 TaxID=1005705 RepID=F5W2D4_9STRE|nr:hypothetical protein HMPREF9967_0893 [Streptococcus infantis SK1076]
MTKIQGKNFSRRFKELFTKISLVESFFLRDRGISCKIEKVKRGIV